MQLFVKSINQPFLCEDDTFRGINKFMKQLRSALSFVRHIAKWHYFWPLAVIGVLLIGSSGAAVYTRSAAYQQAIDTPPAPQIIVVKDKKAAAAAPTPATTTEQTATSTTTSTQPSSGTTPKKTSTVNLATACNDKINSIYYNYNMALATENGRNQQVLASIQEDYDNDVYYYEALIRDDGTTEDILRDADIADENVRHDTATINLANDEQAQMKASNCFGV